MGKRKGFKLAVDVLNEARTYLVEFLRGKSNPFGTRHPWRKSWEFVVLHSLRVETYVLKILERKQHDLAEDEVILLRLAAILHDIGKFETTNGHSELGIQIVSTWLHNRPEVLEEISDDKRLLDLIGGHSNKGGIETDFSKAVLKDADTLDEVGAMSVFMTTNWLDPQSPFFFHHLKRRLVESELPYCDKKAGILNTQGAREILEEKRVFIETLIAQLSDELDCGTHDEQIFELSRGPR